MQIIPTMVDNSTSLSAVYFNQIPLEETNLISSVGITPSASDLNQIGKSIANYSSAGDFYIDGGSANAYVLTPVTGIGIAFQGATQLFDGMKIRFNPVNTNTGASTVNLNGLGVINILLTNGNAIAPGDIENGFYLDLTYKAAIPAFVINNPQVSIETPYPAGYQSQMFLQNNSSSITTQVDMLPGYVRDASNVANINLISTITKTISATWVAGSGNGGNSVSLAANTTYFYFVIMSSSGIVDAGFDTSPTAANLLAVSGYSYYRTRGFIVTDSAMHPLLFSQTGDNFYLNVPQSILIPYANNVAFFYPQGTPDARVFIFGKAAMNIASLSGSSTVTLFVTSYNVNTFNETGSYTAEFTYDGSTVTNIDTSWAQCESTYAGQLVYSLVITGSSVLTIYWTSYGWIDYRGGA